MNRIARIAALGCKAVAIVALAPVILLAHVAKWLDSPEAGARRRMKLPRRFAHAST